MMKGLLVWSHSFCRSTVAFYEGLARAFDVPMRMLFWMRGFSNRTAVGYSGNEFEHLDMRFIGDDLGAAHEEYAAHRHWHHLFGTYQKGVVFRRMLLQVSKEGGHAAIATEAPCNMQPFPRSLLKECFISTALRHKVTQHVRVADFVVNFSGDDDGNLRRIGWPVAKVVPCGYYSPPLVGSVLTPRTSTHWRDFWVLMTGRHQWHRDPMVLLKALTILAGRGVRCRTVVSQDGPLLPEMQRYAGRHGLDVEFAGFVSYERLLELYQECTCFVGTGRAEPWGIRVNDALHCGAPLAISEGMGAVKLVRDYACGFSFPRRDAAALAANLEDLIRDEKHYLRCATAVCRAAAECRPFVKAGAVAATIQRRFPGWS